MSLCKSAQAATGVNMFNVLNTQNIMSTVAGKWQCLNLKSLCNFNVMEEKNR